MDKVIQAKPDYYKGIRFRSKLESKTAQTLDILGMPWVYEPHGYMLSNGLWYKPDFLLPAAKQFIECKGTMSENDSAKIIRLVKDTSCSVLALSYKNAMLCVKPEEANEVWTYFSDDALYVGQCYKCNGRFFYSDYGSYECSCCDYYDGDHTVYPILQIESATQLFNGAKQIAANNPLYKEISAKFNKEV